MNKKDTVFDFMTHVMVIWGIEVLSLCVFCKLFGNAAMRESTMFALGSTGVTISTLMQYLLLAFLITCSRWLFFTDKWIKEMSIPVRTTMMLASSVVFVVIEAAVFGWFIINDIKAWVMFGICFGVCTVISVGITTLKEKRENQKMQKALERLKGEEF